MALSVLLGFLVVLSTGLVLGALASPTRYDQDQPKEAPGAKEHGTRNSVQVLVLGDIGRSPRMQYHALSVAKHGVPVQLIGFVDSELLPALLEHDLVTVLPVPSSPQMLQTSNKVLFAFFGPLKVLFQIYSLWQVLGYRTRPSRWLLVQNPPSIPTLAVAALTCTLRSTKLVIDWHNFGYSILALKLGPEHPFIRMSKLYEQLFAHLAFAHLTVTRAMGDALARDLNVKAPILTLHDRPAPQFQPLTENQKKSFISSNFILSGESQDLLQQKTRLLVSSTSWTPDEDFVVLLEALCIYSEKATSTHPQLPEILTVITGKGPQRDHYLERIDQLEGQGKLEMVSVKTAWLSFADYASLLGAADLGVSLHTSSSGVDLPMKVVDMFGAGLPVVGWSRFKAWPELVRENVNGKGFTSATELADTLVELFDPQSTSLSRLKEGAILEGKRRWDQEWNSVAGPLLGLSSR